MSKSPRRDMTSLPLGTPIERLILFFPTPEGKYDYSVHEIALESPRLREVIQIALKAGEERGAVAFAVADQIIPVLMPRDVEMQPKTRSEVIYFDQRGAKNHNIPGLPGYHVEESPEGKLFLMGNDIQRLPPGSRPTAAAIRHENSPRATVLNILAA